MRSILKSLTAAFGLTALATSALADWAPPGPIKLMIGFAAGGGADTQARLIAEELENRLGWQFIPEQVTGKGGLNLLAALKDQPSDGTAIGMVVTESLGYSVLAAGVDMTPKDFTPIVTTAGFQMAIVAPSASGYGSFAQVVDAAKGGQDIRFGVMSPRLADLAYLLGKAQGVDFNIISVRGGRAVVNGLNAGDMDIGFAAGIQAAAVAAGDMVELVSALSVPLAMTPDAPTLADLGVPFNSDGHFLFVAPAGMPQTARDALAHAIEDIVSDETTKAGALIRKGFGGASVLRGARLQEAIDKEYEGAAALIRAASE